MLKRHPFGPGLFVAACGCAALLSASACSDNNTKPAGTAGDTSAAPAAQATTADRDNTVNKPISLTGCLQQGDSRSSYVLTEINEPNSRPTATSGSDASGKVEHEQMREARHAYRLDAKDDTDLAKLVGNTVRVSGTLTDRSDLTARNDRAHDQGTAGTSGKNDRDREKISESDLAKVDVTSIEKVADACGSGSAAASPSKGAAKGTKSGRTRR